MNGCREGVSIRNLVRAALTAIALLVSPHPAHAECVITSDDAPVAVGLRVEVGEEEPPEVQLHRASVVITLHRRSPSTVVARGAITVEGQLDPGQWHTGFALRPGMSVGGVLRTGSSPVAVHDVHVVDERAGLAEAELSVAGLGILRLTRVPCTDLVVAGARSPRAPSAIGGVRPRGVRAALRPSPREAPTVWWLAEESESGVAIIESSGHWRRIGAVPDPGVTLDAWARASDLVPDDGTERPSARRTRSRGSLLCVRSHEPLPTHAHVRVGAPIVRVPGGPAIALATSERSFTIWVPWDDEWIAIIGVPQMGAPCPSPFGFVRMTDVLDIDVYDRAGVALRIDRERWEYVVLRVEGSAAESGARPGDVVLRIGSAMPRPTDRHPEHVAVDLHDATSPIVVRRDGVEIELPALRNWDEARGRRREPDAQQYFDF